MGDGPHMRHRTFGFMWPDEMPAPWAASVQNCCAAVLPSEESGSNKEEDKGKARHEQRPANKAPASRPHASNLPSLILKQRWNEVKPVLARCSGVAATRTQAMQRLSSCAYYSESVSTRTAHTSRTARKPFLPIPPCCNLKAPAESPGTVSSTLSGRTIVLICYVIPGGALEPSASGS